MPHRFFKNLGRRALAEMIALYSSIVVACVLAVAAWGKIFYPSEYLKTLDRWTSVFEIIFLFTIVIFRKRRQLWLLASSIFAAWGGYALFWCCVKLPCACMGKMLNIPSAVSISLDALFFILSLFVSCLLGSQLRSICWGLIAGCLAILAGYAFASLVYEKIFLASLG